MFCESELIIRSKATAIASCKVVQALAKKKTPSEDCNIMRGCLFIYGRRFIFSEYKN